MILDRLTQLGFDYSKAPLKVLNAISLLKVLKQEDKQEQLEKVKILDQKILDALLNNYPSDPILKKVKDEENKAEGEVFNDGFNTSNQPNREDNAKAFIEEIISNLENLVKLNKRSLEKIAAKHKITDITKVYEYTEYAWVKFYRKLALQGTDFEETYKNLTNFYLNIQPVYSLRDSVRIEFQQYSTPSPIAYLAQEFCKVREAGLIFEPSAGNGLLVFESPYERTIVNELDRDRYDNLTRDPYLKVLKQDAELRFVELKGKVDALLSNPPFGRLAQKAEINGYDIKALDHAMIAIALETLKPSGRAGIIIGGHTRYNETGMISAFRIFFNWLFHFYHVSDIINIDGDLYYKQGTTFDIRLILINSRKEKPDGFAPIVRDLAHPFRQVVISFEDLFERVNNSLEDPYWLIPKDKTIKVIEAPGMNPSFRPDPMFKIGDPVMVATINGKLIPDAPLKDYNGRKGKIYDFVWDNAKKRHCYFLDEYSKKLGTYLDEQSLIPFHQDQATPEKLKSIITQLKIALQQ